MNHLTGQNVFVVGAAPLLPGELLDCRGGDTVIAVNGGISSVTGPVTWVVNAREHGCPGFGPIARARHRLMLSQGAGRLVTLAVLLSKSDRAAADCIRFLTAQHTEVKTWIEFGGDHRLTLETRVGARDPQMQRHALSAGLFAVCWALDNGAKHVEMVGFSWEPGYAYTNDPTIDARGHAAGDKMALRRLATIARQRVSHSLPLQARRPEETEMPRKTAKKAAAAPPPPVPARSARASRRAMPPIFPAVTENDVAPTPAPVTERRPSSNVNMPKAIVRRVRATKLLIYEGQRRRTGEVFTLTHSAHFRKGSMEAVDQATPLGAPQRQAQMPPGRLQQLQPNAADPLPSTQPKYERFDTSVDPLGLQAEAEDLKR